MIVVSFSISASAVCVCVSLCVLPVDRVQQSSHLRLTIAIESTCNDYTAAQASSCTTYLAWTTSTVHLIIPLYWERTILEGHRP